jgi:hypothetical protein
MATDSSNDERDTEQMPSIPSSSSSSLPPPSSYLPSLLRAGTGVVLALAVAVRLIPALLGFLETAQKGPCGGWEKWVPSAVVAALLLAVAAPTSLRDLTGIVTAAKGLLGKGDK